MKNPFDIQRTLWLACLTLFLAGCSDEQLTQALADGNTSDGDAVLFTTFVPGKAETRTAQDDFVTRMASYKAVAEDYVFNINMYQEPLPETEPTLIGSGTYQPTKTVTTVGDVVTTRYDADGTLVATTPLYWPDSQNRYGFKATAGTETLEADQSTKENWLLQDQLVGYGFMPIWEGTAEDGNPKDHEDTLNYRTLKEWKAANESLGLSTPEQYKKIPLYLRHQRALITIRLKAGEGVERSALTYDHAMGDEDAEGHISTTIYSYAGSPVAAQEIQPLAKATTIDYASTDYGVEATGVETTEYTCVVEPHNYLEEATSEPIARINLSGQHFTFYASNDFQYSNYKADVPEAVTHMQGYNLQAGQHLIITATLGRASRKILITAYVEDWTEAVTTSIVDDYGNSGEPILINSRQELYDFLKSDKNRPGNVAIIVPNSLNLDTGAKWYYNEDDSTENDLDLWCTLNLAGATLRTTHQIFKNIHPMGNLVNGTISVGNATVQAAVAETSVGSLEHINVVPRDAAGNNSTGMASRAGLVVFNSGKITNCSSELPVYGTYDSTTGSKKNVVGGIAAYSDYSEENGNTMPIIDGCTVNARVDGEVLYDGVNATAGVQGAGIVGEAAGRVTNNTFIYGRTLLQDATYFKNTIHHKVGGVAESPTLRASGNAWPTTANANGNGIPSTNINTAATTYDHVIDSQIELDTLLNATNNINGKSYRLSKDFTVTKAATPANNNKGWNHGKQNDVLNSSGSGVLFKLDGNNHTITTDAMLFTNIQNDISNLTIQLGGDMIATSESGGAPTGTEAIAPLGYSVCAGATISNIRVKGGDYRIQAPTVGGVVVWAYGDATVADCQCKAKIQVWLPGPITDGARKYTGGIVATAEVATITRCVFHNTDETLFMNTSDTYTTNTESPNDQSVGIYYGGILGGTAKKTDNTPSVTITDCTSWFSTKDNQYKGAIVGWAQYADGSSNLQNGIHTEACEGNWWSTSSDAVGTGHNSFTSDEQIVGKRNAVTPTQDNTY